MGSSTGATEGTGLTRAHTWGFIVPLLVILSVPYVSKYVHVSTSQPINAIAGGAAVTAIAYLLMTKVPGLTENSHVLGKAVLAGLLIAEILVLKPYGALPSMATITLWLFFYYHTVESHVA